MLLQPPAPLLLAILATAAALPADSGTALMDMHQVRGFKHGWSFGISTYPTTIGRLEL